MEEQIKRLIGKWNNRKYDHNQAWESACEQFIVDLESFQKGGEVMKMPKTKQSENNVKKAIKEYLELNGYEVFRINNGGGFRGVNKDGNPRFSFNGTPGVFDLYCVRHRHNDMWIETKATGKKPSDAQIKFMELVNSVPGRYAFWCDSFDMFLPIYNDINNGWGLPKH